MRGLDGLVASGKVRYIGFSDLPTWKVSEAQTIAHFRGWAPIIAVQLEYSLLDTPATRMIAIHYDLVRTSGTFRGRINFAKSAWEKLIA